MTVEPLVRDASRGLLPANYLCDPHLCLVIVPSRDSGPDDPGTERETKSVVQLVLNSVLSDSLSISIRSLERHKHK